MLGDVVAPCSGAGRTRADQEEVQSRPAEVATTLRGFRKQDAPVVNAPLGSLWTSGRCWRSFHRLQGAQAQRYGGDSGIGADHSRTEWRCQQRARVSDHFGITGLAGEVNTKGLNPLFNANTNTT